MLSRHKGGKGHLGLGTSPTDSVRWEEGPGRVSVGPNGHMSVRVPAVKGHLNANVMARYRMGVDMGVK